MNIRNIEQTAIRAAKEAGALIRQKCGKAARTMETSSAYDLVTEVDKACEEIVRRHVTAQFPSGRFGGVAFGVRGSGAAERVLGSRFERVGFVGR